MYGAVLLTRKVYERCAAFWQTVVEPEITAVGNGFTIIVAVPLCLRTQVELFFTLTGYKQMACSSCWGCYGNGVPVPVVMVYWCRRLYYR